MLLLRWQQRAPGTLCAYAAWRLQHLLASTCYQGGGGRCTSGVGHMSAPPCSTHLAVATHFRTHRGTVRVPGDDKATAKLLGAALGSSSDGGDLELGCGVGAITASRAPRWVVASERTRAEMMLLRDRIVKLRE